VVPLPQWNRPFCELLDALELEEQRLLERDAAFNVRTAPGARYH
jgi:hypothetical protein